MSGTPDALRNTNVIAIQMGILRCGVSHDGAYLSLATTSRTVIGNSDRAVLTAEARSSERYKRLTTGSDRHHDPYCMAVRCKHSTPLALLTAWLHRHRFRLCCAGASDWAVSCSDDRFRERQRKSFCPMMASG
jgi:hypothetical protein